MKITTFPGLTAVGATTPINADTLGTMVNSYPVQCVVTGDPLTITVDVEGSLDSTNWSVIETHVFTAGELTALSAMFSVINKPSRFIRANVSTLTFTTAATVVVSVAI